VTNWTVTHDGALSIVTFHRPPRNFMSFRALGELADILNDLAPREDVTAVLWNSALPGYFVAHAELDDLAKAGRGEPVEGERTAWRTTPLLLESMPQPVIAAIDGQAWGGGTELALACTLRVVSQSSSFGLPEVAMAQTPGGGGTQRLPRLIGAGRALDVILSGRKLDAAEALQYGLVNAVLPDEDFAEGAVAYAQRIARQDRATVLAGKRLVLDGLGLSLADGLGLERESAVTLTRQPESLSRRDELARRYAAAPPEERVDF
jgi:enoyl-CoA hydratase